MSRTSSPPPSGAAGGLSDPLPRELERGLRALVFELAGTGHRRPAPTLSVGTPGGPREVADLALLEHRTDHALRTEVVASLLRLARAYDDGPVCWLTRPGTTSWHDLDAAWLAAALDAYAEAAVPLTWLVVTRTAWWDPRSGLTRVWQRPRRPR